MFTIFAQKILIWNSKKYQQKRKRKLYHLLL